MFRIRRIYDDTLPVNREVIKQAQAILKSRFSGLSPEDIQNLPEQLSNPLKFRFRSILFSAEDTRGILKGFALLLHAPDLEFTFLDYISAASRSSGRGIGSALYERVREESLLLKAGGLFFECLPDDPALCRDASVLKENASRLRFYERFGARPVAGTAYETPLKPGGDCPPYLVFDSLGSERTLSRKKARTIVRAILERKYGSVCPPGYIDMVAASFSDDPVRLRPRRYVKEENRALPVSRGSVDTRIALIVTDNHDIHHVHDRGYVESPVRIGTILRGIEETGLFERIKPRHFSESCITAVHDREFVNYLKKVCDKVPPEHSVYPYVFPIRNAARPPKELPVRAGYYCIDTFTPLNENAFRAAKRSVDCALTAADCIVKGSRTAYALVRPPGHHAEYRTFGGFCYFNSTAAAAQYLSERGKVAILDIDYHHGNGQQEIFLQRRDIFTVSIHGHPSFAYPYFSGFEDEKGKGKGLGFNMNLPLPEKVDGPAYRKALGKALGRIRAFSPRFLIIAFGLDTAKNDPTGSWELMADDFEENGAMIGALGLPVLVVQEGGYRVKSLGVNARRFFTGLWKGYSLFRRGLA